MSLVALAGGMLNTYSRFAVPAFTPVLLNLSIIALALLAGAAISTRRCWRWPGGVSLGGVLQLALQLPAPGADRHAAAPVALRSLRRSRRAPHPDR
ncbi:MAG: hypothetical protein MZW92_29490 [Comamonadaceae bacterium]|nr:hypothetical protein [Comamonadaceae bacterium]